MSRYMPGKSRRIRPREQNIILLILAIIIVVLFWNFIGVLLRVLFFAVVVYIVYRLLQSYL